ncbi:Proline HYdroxylase [Fasciola hepatica]|uniref:procollagen-proline 4-dioxygenase n=1 Tax=Fasciola hepatica TaxID=6192 RepID=A0A4E0RL45_FASHE|nr:Proline HYdroxylase [Fasciola hepatica]
MVSSLRVVRTMMQLLKWLIALSFGLLSIFTQNGRCTAEYFSATVEINKASEVGRQLASDLAQYLKMEEDRLNRVRQVAERLASDRYQQVNETPEDYFGNPVNAYLTVKRLAFERQQDLLQLLNSSIMGGVDEAGASLDTDHVAVADLMARVQEHISQLPGDSDLSGAADALLRLQATYKLSAEQLAKGRLIDTLKCPRLNAAQCMHLGQRAYEQGEFLRAEEWFRVAYNRLWESETQRAADERGDSGRVRSKRETIPQDSEEFTIPHEIKPTDAQILDHLAYALGRQGRYQEALNVTRMMLERVPSDSRALENEAFYVNRIQLGEGIIGPAPPPETLSRYDQETENYQAVCRGEQIFPPPPASSVYCRYHVPHPHYLIGPVKEEILYPDPRMVMWYDTIHDDEITRIQELAKPRLRRATVKNPVTGQLEFAFYRTSKSAWLPDDLDEVTHRMNQRIHALTGLNMDASEDLQVGNYGIGGYYAPHFDFGRKREKDAFEVKNGNRIATIIFYMSEVTAGGGTAFNRIGALVRPIRRASAFWWNLLPSGEGDLRTRHAACPVLVGSKWVMNVWFHERGQEFIRPCELEQGKLEEDDGF